MKQSKSAMVVIAFVLAALVLTVSGCAIGGGRDEYRDSKVPIVVEKGSEFAIVLESNPTTGYQWKLGGILDEKVVSLLKSVYEEPESELMGAPGEEKWTFKAEGLGETTISLIYVRPWEEETQEVSEGTQATESATSGGHSSQGETGQVSQSTSESTATGEASEQGGQSSGSEEVAEPEEEAPTSMTFHVRVVKKGSVDKEAKQYKDENTPIEVEQDLKFAIVLESNPTTGYSWQLAQPLDESVVELVSSEYEKKAGEKEGQGAAVGSGGEEVWTFLAVGAGDTKIEFKYVRPWEKDAAPEEEKTFSVTISPAEETAAK